MSQFSDLFKDKIKSSLLREHIEELVRDMTSLKRENYYAMIDVDKRKDKIRLIEEALTELNIDCQKEYNPYEDLEDN